MSPLPPESHRTDIPFPYLTLFRSRSGAAVAQLPQALQVMQRDRRSDRQINEAFGHFIALKVGDGVGRQMEADVSDQHQAAARKRQRSTARRAEIGRAHSELQSLMRISYAVFCLKNKNHT